MSSKKIKVIAEIGVNHNGKVSLAKKLIKSAKECGAHYVKFQIFNAEEYVTKSAPQAKYQIKNLKKKTSQFKMIKRLELTKKDFLEIYKYTKKIKINFLASCFDLKSLKFYSTLSPTHYKIPSGEITNLPLLKAIGKKNKKVLLSTGMANFNEISDAVNILLKCGTARKNLTILQCTTDYPTKPSDANLLVIPELRKKFSCKVGYSDHTEGFFTSVSAMTMGASVIEKHITLNKKLKGPDHKASLDINEFKKFVEILKNTEASFGKKKKTPTVNEKKNLLVVRKSLVEIQKIKKGQKFTLNNIGIKRPGYGINPMKIDKILGKKAKKNYEEDSLI